MRKIIIWGIIILASISLIRTLSTGKPTIYKEIEHNKAQLLESIKGLKETSRIERIIAVSDSTIAKSIKIISNKINKIHYDYYYITDYCIDHFQKDRMLSSMTLDEWYEFKKNINSWDIMKGASCTLGPYTSQDYRVKTLDEIEKEVLSEQ